MLIFKLPDWPTNYFSANHSGYKPVQHKVMLKIIFKGLYPRSYNGIKQEFLTLQST